MRNSVLFSRGRIFLSAMPFIFLAAAAPAAAQSYTVLQAFRGGPQSTEGNLVQASDGNFYGMTRQGGANGLGSVFRMTPAGALTTLYSFSGSDGHNPYGALVQGTDGNLYGTTNSGGVLDYGTVFRITPAGALTMLYPFSGIDGRNPTAGLVQGTDGSFYGTTYSGGYTYGTIFKITPAGALTTLHRFAGGVSSGRNPYAGLVQGTDGNFYGTTLSASGSSGTVFKITPAGALTTLYVFAPAAANLPNYGSLVQGNDGNFYGATGFGGPSVYGTVPIHYGTLFKITPAGALTTLYTFAGSDGRYPRAGLVQGTDGNFYGTTNYGGVNDSGTVFRITPTGTLTTIYSSSGGDGRYPTAGLVQGTDGSFYGTASSGGAYGSGTVFRITPTGTLATLYSFAGSDIRSPYAGLVQGTDGNFYGTTYSGGTSNYGTVFRMTPAGALTRLYAFAGSDGSHSYAALVQGTDGNFYGTASGGGATGYGTVFRITPAGALTTLYSFAGSDGQNPYAGLVQGTDGNFYGTASAGGAIGYGTVFRMTPAGALTTLHSFAASDGASPYASVVQGTDGNFYGTASTGGANGYGTVFRMTPVGALTTLYSFAGSDGKYPYYGSLVQGTDGNFYGTTYQGGTSNYGTVFKMTPAGALTTLRSFASSDGVMPYTGLVQGTDGNFYGTTYTAGVGGYGTIFMITPAGTLTRLYSFAGTDGSNPRGSLIQGADGNFYGTTSSGGHLGGGVVFRLTPGAGPAPTVTGVSPASGPLSGGAVVTVSGTGFQPGATVSFGGSAAGEVTYISSTTLYALTPDHAAGTVTVTVTNPGSGAGSLSSAYTYICPWIPLTANGGPFCAGGTISLSTPSIPGATYSWTGPNGFTSAAPNPTIFNATSANVGTYSLSVSVPGCTSGAGRTTVVVNPVPSVPVVTAPATVMTGSANQTASVVLHAGSTYQWTIANGTIASGQGTNQIAFTAGTPGTLTLSVVEVNSSGCSSPQGKVDVSVVSQQLLLSKGRVGVTVDWRNPYSGETGTAYVLPQDDKFGFLYYSDPNNPEVFVKVLDFGSGSALCFVGGLTDFYYKVTFTMLSTRETLVFEKPEKQYIGFVDATTLKYAGAPETPAESLVSSGGMTFVGALATGEPAPVSKVAPVMTEKSALAEPLAAAPQSLAFSSGRVSVTVDWRNPYSGETGRAYGIPKADQFGFFYYTDASNPEVFVKVLDFGSGSALCFVGGLTDFYYKVTFTVLRTGQPLVFEKPEKQYVGFVDATTLKY
jgi:uncharacterized repeat protein (TIGR03803 family)